MTGLKQIVVAVAAVIIPTVLLGAQLKNASFETDFGLPEDENVWGDRGIAFGECYQVYANGDHPKRARTGERMLLINVPPDSWNGIWQELPWDEFQPYAWEGYYRIVDSDLPADTATFLKVEFYDASGEFISSEESDRFAAKTFHRWERCSMEGATPEGTAIIRFIIMGGRNPAESTIANRIYWDDIAILE